MKVPRFNVLLMLLACLLFSPTLLNGFETFQDPLYLQNNPYLALGLGALPRIFSETFNGEFEPLTQLLFLLIHAVAGFHPLAFHLVQILLMACAAALIPRALALFQVSERVSVAAAVLWLANPFQVSAVSAVSNLSTALSALLLLVSASLLLADKRTASLVLFVSAVFAHAAVAPLGLLLAVHQYRQVTTRVSAGLFTAASLAGMALTGILHSGNAVVPVASLSLLTRAALPVWYLEHLLFPHALRVIYDLHEVKFFDLGSVLTVGFWTVLLGTWAVLFVRKSAVLPAFSLVVAAWFLSLETVLFWPPAQQAVAEHFAIFASVVLSLVVAWALSKLAGKFMWVAVALLAVPLSLVNTQRQREWVDGVTLWKSNTALTPENALVVANLATAYGSQNQFKEAYDAFQRVRVLQPRRPGLSCALAVARAAREGVDSGWITTALPQLCTASPEVRWAAARGFLQQRDPRARVLIEELDMGADRSKAAVAAASLALQQKDFEGALTLSLLAREWGAPVESVVLTQAIALLQLSQFQEAMKLTETPVADEKLHFQLQGVRAGALSKLGRAEEAEELFQQSMQRLKELGEKVGP